MILKGGCVTDATVNYFDNGYIANRIKELYNLKLKWDVAI